MSYSATLSTQARCVSLTHTDAISPEEALAARQEAIKFLRTLGWHRLLVDVTGVKNSLSSTELFTLGAALARDLPRGTRLALVVRPDQTRRAKVVETLARKNGVFLTYFVDAHKAAVWVQDGLQLDVSCRVPALRPAVGLSGPEYSATAGAEGNPGSLIPPCPGAGKPQNLRAAC